MHPKPVGNKSVLKMSKKRSTAGLVRLSPARKYSSKVQNTDASEPVPIYDPEMSIDSITSHRERDPSELKQ
jgi:hypothetical protein